MNTLEQLVSCRFDLINIILNRKSTLDPKTLSEVKTQLSLVKALCEKVRENKNLDYQEQLVQIQECVSKAR